MRQVRNILACVVLFVAASVLAAGPTPLGVVTAIPAQDITPAGAVSVASVNAIEVTGRVTGGSGVLFLLRKTYTQTTGTVHYQFRPWYEDRPIDPFAQATAGGYFTARYRLPANTTGEVFVLYNPGGTVTIDGATPLIARGINY